MLPPAHPCPPPPPHSTAGDGELYVWCGSAEAPVADRGYGVLVPPNGFAKGGSRTQQQAACCLLPPLPLPLPTPLS
jgi:hypothetical protein